MQDSGIAVCCTAIKYIRRGKCIRSPIPDNQAVDRVINLYGSAQSGNWQSKSLTDQTDTVCGLCGVMSMTVSDHDLY